MTGHEWGPHRQGHRWSVCARCGTEAVRTFGGGMLFLHPEGRPVDHGRTGPVSEDCDETLVREVMAS